MNTRADLEKSMFKWLLNVWGVKRPRRFFFLFLIAAGEDKRPKGECFGGTRLSFRDPFPVT